MAKFVLFDQEFLIYGARVLVSGMNIEEFKLNPVMLYNHHRTWRGTKDEMLPIGRWDEIEKDETKLYGSDYYDKKDDFAQAIKNKVEQKILNMASVTLMVISTSDDPSVLVQGQTRPTIIECKVIEASIVDFGRNKGAYRLQLRRTDEEGNEVITPTYVKLIDETGAVINLKEDNHLLPLLKAKEEGADQPPTKTPPNEQDSNLENSDMTKEERKQLCLSLSLEETATDAEILQAQDKQNEELVRLRGAQGTTTEEKNELEQFRASKKATEKAAREVVVEEAIKARKIVAADKEKYLELMEKAPETTKALLKDMPEVAELRDTDQGLGDKEDPWALREKEIRDNLK